MSNFVPAPADELIEDRATRRKVYKAAQYVGLTLAAATAGLTAFGVTPDAYPWLLAAWSVFGVVDAWTSSLAAKNVNV